jgi:hypothetical protein
MPREDFMDELNPYSMYELVALGRIRPPRIQVTAFIDRGLFEAISQKAPHGVSKFIQDSMVKSIVRRDKEILEAGARLAARRRGSLKEAINTSLSLDLNGRIDSLQKFALLHGFPRATKSSIVGGAVLLLAEELGII